MFDYSATSKSCAESDSQTTRCNQSHHPESTTDGILSRHNGTLLSVPLIHLPCQDIAVIGFRTMLHRIAEPTWARLWAGTPTLIVRESCGAYLPQTKAK